MPQLLEDTEIPFGRSLGAVRAKWPWLVVPAVLGMVAGALVAFSQPTRYEGVSTLMVAQPKFSTDAKPISVSNFRALLQTNTIAMAAIAHFGLDKPPHNLTASSLQRDVLIVEEVRNTNLLRAHVRLADPKLAAAVANFLADESVAFNERLDSQESTYYRGQLKSQVNDASARLRAAEQRLLEFHRTAQVDLVKRDADSALDERGELLRLMMDIETERARLSTAEREIQRQERVLTIPRQVAADAALLATAAATEQTESRARAAATERRSRADGLPTETLKSDAPERGSGIDAVVRGSRAPRADAKNGDRHQNGLAASERMAVGATGDPTPSRDRTVESEQPSSTQLDLSNPFINPVYQVLDYQIALGRTKLAGLERRRTELMTVLHLGGKEIEALSRLYPQQIELRRLDAEHEITSTLYAEVAQQYERARLQIASNSARLQVVDVAVEPDAPLPRHRVLYVLLGLLLGLTGGALAAFVSYAGIVSPARGVVHPR